ncbi:unnamed protein product [Allacma fusca]|uniref:Uncharacterized protein n=1 Tax=Allacma fusca TaxID=39272 RepID=A0A8J2PK03_9HEXA|nr:unnamed protein product [Allacma fusca]
MATKIVSTVGSRCTTFSTKPTAWSSYYQMFLSHRSVVSVKDQMVKSANKTLFLHTLPIRNTKFNENENKRKKEIQSRYRLLVPATI